MTVVRSSSFRGFVLKLSRRFGIRDESRPAPCTMKSGDKCKSANQRFVQPGYSRAYAALESDVRAQVLAEYADKDTILA